MELTKKKTEPTAIPLVNKESVLEKICLNNSTNKAAKIKIRVWVPKGKRLKLSIIKPKNIPSQILTEIPTCQYKNIKKNRTIENVIWVGKLQRHCLDVREKTKREL